MKEEKLKKLEEKTLTIDGTKIRKFVNKRLPETLSSLSRSINGSKDSYLSDCIDKGYLKVTDAATISRKYLRKFHIENFVTDEVLRKFTPYANGRMIDIDRGKLDNHVNEAIKDWELLTYEFNQLLGKSDGYYSSSIRSGKISISEAIMFDVVFGITVESYVKAKDGSPKQLSLTDIDKIQETPEAPKMCKVYEANGDELKKLINESVHDAIRDVITSMLKAIGESEVIE